MGAVKGNILVRIACTILVFLMFIGLFLPVLSLPSPSKYLGDVSDAANLYMGWELIDTIADVYDAGAMNGVLHSFADQRLTDLGRADNRYGYDNGRLDNTLDDLYDEYESKYEDIIDTAVFLDSEYSMNQLKNLLEDEDFQEFAGEFMFDYMLYSVIVTPDEIGIEVTAKDVRNVMSVLRTIARCEAENSVSPVMAAIVMLGTGRVLVSDGFQEVARYTASLEEFSSVYGLVFLIGALVFILLLLAYALLLVFAAVCIWKNRKSGVKGLILAATILAGVQFAVLAVGRWFIPKTVRSCIGAPAAYLYFVIIFGIAACVMISMLWNKRMKRPLSGGKKPKTGWICSCGRSCDGKEMFCPVCGSKKPENASSGWTCICGTQWGSSDKFCAVCGGRRPENTDVCSNCGASLAGGECFCPECGSAI